MTGHWLIILKTFLRTSVDNYVLPGTATGTDILLIYMTEWKRHFVLVTSLVTSATICLIASQFDLPRSENTFPDISNEIRDGGSNS